MDRPIKESEMGQSGQLGELRRFTEEWKKLNYRK